MRSQCLVWHSQAIEDKFPFDMYTILKSDVVIIFWIVLLQKRLIRYSTSYAIDIRSFACSDENIFHDCRIMLSAILASKTKTLLQAEFLVLWIMVQVQLSRICSTAVSQDREENKRKYRHANTKSSTLTKLLSHTYRNSKVHDDNQYSSCYPTQYWYQK